VTRAVLRSDEPVAYRVVVVRTPKPTAHPSYTSRTVRFGPYGTLGAARGVATAESRPAAYSSWDSVATIEAVRGDAWEAVPS